MAEMTITEFSLNLRTIFNRIEYKNEEIVLIRHNHRIARVIPGLKLVVFDYQTELQ